MKILSIVKGIFSLDTLIYLAMLLLFMTAFVRCIVPLWSVSSRLRRAARVIITENRQNKEKKSWRDLRFLGDKLQGTWTDFLQNAEMRDAHGTSCDVTRYINEETIIYASSATRLAELAPGIFTSLGILGTFLGLVMGLSGLTLNAADTAALLAGMEKLIAGMSTAFLTSIVGVVASVAFHLLYNRQVEKCERAIDRFCDVFSLYAMPKPVSEETAMLSLQQEQTAYMRQAVEEIGQKMAVQMEQSILRAMLPVQRSMDNFILAATQAQVEGVDRIAQVFVQRMNAALGHEFDHLQNILAQTGVEQQKAQQELRATMEAIGRMTQDVVNMHQLSQGVLEHFRDYVTDMDASRAQVDETSRKTLELLSAMNKTSGQQAMYLARLQEYQAALADTQQRYAAMTDQFLMSAQEQTRLTAQEMDRVVAELHEGGQALTGSYESFTKQTQENMARTTALFDESMSTAVAQLDRTLSQVKETTQLMPQLLSQSRERYAEQVDQFVTALVRLQKSMERVSEAAEKAAGSAGQDRKE